MKKALLTISAGILILAGGLYAASDNETETSPISPSGWIEGTRPFQTEAAGGGKIMAVDTWWRTSGNAETTPGTHFLGTTDNQALEIKVYGARAFRLEPDSYSPHIIGGYSGNSISTGCYGAVISGGGKSGYVNQISGGGQFSVIGGGSSNYINDFYATISGGSQNQATENYASIGGGVLNTASGARSTVCGGQSNAASGPYSAICGGYKNDAVSGYSVIGGGYDNTASGWYAVVPGGASNEASATCAFAAGNDAKANHAGTFVWADNQGVDFASTGTKQFLVRAQGGIWFGTNSSPSIPTGRFINTSTGAYLSTGGTWTNASDKNLKQDFVEVDAEEVLEKVAELEVTSWSYKEAPEVTHIGPVAQDFHEAFGVGTDDKSISTVDADGIALASIQALYKENQELKNQLETQQILLESQKQYLNQLENRLENLEQSRKKYNDD